MNLTLRRIAKAIQGNGGRAIIENKVLRHVGPAFSEDPLRVFRILQFAGRFGFSVAEETATLCRGIDVSSLPRERVWEEIKKLLLKSEKPSVGFNLLGELGLESYFPEVWGLHKILQDPRWHPEGDVFVHTIEVLDKMASLSVGRTNQERLILMVAALCHDMGKAVTTVFNDGSWTAYGHASAGVEMAEGFLQRLTNELELIKEVLTLVREHMLPHELFRSSQGGLTVGRAMVRLSLRANMDLLSVMAEADSKTDESAKWFRDNTPIEPVKPLVMGRDLMGLGMKPGPIIGDILKKTFEAQLDGKFTSKVEGLEWIKKGEKR